MSNPLTEPQVVARGVATESDKASHGQRRVNLIWEVTQSTIALGITGAIIYVATRNANTDVAILGNAFFLIIGFYFGRTNHQKQGGVPPLGVGDQAPR